MTDEGPPLETLMRRLAETPPEFQAEPLIGRGGEVDVAAVAWDVLRELGGEPPRPGAVDAFRAGILFKQSHRNRLKLVLLACWLLSDPWFRGRGELSNQTLKFLKEATDRLDGSMKADAVLRDPDRREELIRVLLMELGLRPAGESVAQAADRLQTLDTAERQRVLQAAAKAEGRAREIREAMARSAAQDAANRYAE